MHPIFKKLSIMANNEKTGSKQDVQVQGNETIVTKTIDFYNKYQKIIYSVLIAVLIVILLVIVVNKFYFQAKNEKGSVAILKPIEYYTQGLQTGDSTLFVLALEGDEENDGFLTLISSNKMTKIANSAKYFAGLSYLQMGDQEEALNYLSNFKKKENVYWYNCQALIGDIYEDQGDDAKAMKYYEKAAKGDDLYYTPVALFKLGQMYEKAGNWKKAYSSYSKIEENYNEQYVNMGVEKYLEKAKIEASL